MSLIKKNTKKMLLNYKVGCIKLKNYLRRFTTVYTIFIATGSKSNEFGTNKPPAKKLRKHRISEQK